MYRINSLLKLDRKLYHTNDLAVIWNTTNRNTLYTTIKRYVQNGVLIPVFKGLYSTVPVNQVDSIKLGRAIIHRFAYLSTESVLAKAGVISQAVYQYTFVSNISIKKDVEGRTFLYRKMKDEFLHNPEGIIEEDGVFTASTERAVADMIYFDHKYHFDVPQVVNGDRVKEIQKEVGYI
jgi:hypothetical protein